jgi:hypothetical protein
MRDSAISKHAASLIRETASERKRDPGFAVGQILATMPLVGGGAVQPMSEGKWSQFATIKPSDTLAERNKLDASGR